MLLFIDQVSKQYKVMMTHPDIERKGFTTYFRTPRSCFWYRFSLPVRSDRSEAEADLEEFAKIREWRKAG